MVAMLLALLPVLSLATQASSVTFESQEALERALTVQVRSALEAGWTIVDVSPEDNGDGIGFTLERDGIVERHIAEIDGGNVYRVEPAALPSAPTKPNAELMEALRGHGVVEIGGRCGIYVDSYMIEGSAIGAEAGAFVARTLAAADDLESAWGADGRAVFQIETGGVAVDLIATLTKDGGIVEAELRRYESREDRVSYRRRAAMVHALRGAFVSSIHQEHDSLVLRTNRGRFAIDPAGKAFRSKHPEGEGEGCGC